MNIAPGSDGGRAVVASAGAKRKKRLSFDGPFGVNPIKATFHAPVAAHLLPKTVGHPASSRVTVPNPARQKDQHGNQASAK